MTEGNEDGNYLVRVRAQVMTRDDSSGGWVPLGGGGLSNVSVRKRVTTQTGPLASNAPASIVATSRSNNGEQRSHSSMSARTQHTPYTVNNNGGEQRSHSSMSGDRMYRKVTTNNHNNHHTAGSNGAEDSQRHGSTGDTDILGQSAAAKHEYLIYGKRISDQSIVLSCTIKKDFEYNKVMPTFHHWKTGDKKFGLTFQTAADARAFDKGVRTAVEELLDGLAETYPLSPLHKYQKDVADDDVFMTLNLPIEAPPGESRSSSECSGSGPMGGGRGSMMNPTSVPVSVGGPEHLQHRIHYICKDRDPSMSPTPTKEQKGDNYSYVQLTAVHEYIYPVVEDSKAARQDSSLKKRSLETLPSQPALPSKPSKQKKSHQKYMRTRCKHCNELFSEDNNARGSCEFAPDCVKSGIDGISCISCAQCMLYHCMADAEGDFAIHPCVCTSVDENCGKRWLGLALLSLLVPCLWCYPPLKACHWCGVTCGICGGRHTAY